MNGIHMTSRDLNLCLYLISSLIVLKVVLKRSQSIYQLINFRCSLQLSSNQEITQNFAVYFSGAQTLCYRYKKLQHFTFLTFDTRHR